MQDNGTAATTDETNQTNTNTTANQSAQTTENNENATAENPEDISYHTVEKDGNVTAIWEMQGRKHIRTIDPRSSEGKQILELFETAA